MIERIPRYGGGYISPDQSKFLLNIAKNASSYMSNLVSHYNWTVATANTAATNQVQEVIVVLRDPVERWISGITQYLNTRILSVVGPNGPIMPGSENPKYDYYISAEQFIQNYNELTERLLFDVIDVFDEHVFPQHLFLTNILPSVPKKCFYLDQNFTNNINQHLGFQLVPDLDMNRSQDNNDKQQLQIFFKQRLRHRPELMQRLVKHYAADYSLIQSFL